MKMIIGLLMVVGMFLCGCNSMQMEVGYADGGDAWAGTAAGVGGWGPAPAAIESAQKLEAVNPLENRKMIWRGDMSIETEDMAVAAKAATALVKKSGGYIETHSDVKDRYVNLRIRVPTANLNSIVAELETLGKVTEKTLDATDITEVYADLEARLKN